MVDDTIGQGREDSLWRTVTIVWQATVGLTVLSLALVGAAVYAVFTLIGGLVFNIQAPAERGFGALLSRIIKWSVEQWRWGLLGGGDGWFYPVPGQRSRL